MLAASPTARPARDRSRVPHRPSLLLDALYKQDVGGLRDEWQAARLCGWSKFGSDDYQRVIDAIRQVVPRGAGLWTIEEYWQGFQ